MILTTAGGPSAHREAVSSQGSQKGPEFPRPSPGVTPPNKTTCGWSESDRTRRRLAGT